MSKKNKNSNFSPDSPVLFLIVLALCIFVPPIGAFFIFIGGCYLLFIFFVWATSKK